MPDKFPVEGPSHKVPSGWSNAQTCPCTCLTAGPLAHCSVEGRELLAIQLTGKQSGRHHQKVKVKVRLLVVCVLVCLWLPPCARRTCNISHGYCIHGKPGWPFTHLLSCVATLLQLVGGIHGNEQACPELLLRLVHHLASLYGRSRRITRLLDATDIHILPVSKPQPTSYVSATNHYWCCQLRQHSHSCCTHLSAAMPCCHHFLSSGPK